MAFIQSLVGSVVTIEIVDLDPSRPGAVVESTRVKTVGVLEAYRVSGDLVEYQLNGTDEWFTIDGSRQQFLVYGPETIDEPRAPNDRPAGIDQLDDEAGRIALTDG